MNLKEILPLCKEFNVKKLRLDNLEVEFNDQIDNIQVPFLDGAPLKEQIGGELKPTQDELLYWSTGEQVEIESKPPEI